MHGVWIFFTGQLRMMNIYIFLIIGENQGFLNCVITTLCFK